MDIYKESRMLHYRKSGEPLKQGTPDFLCSKKGQKRGKSEDFYLFEGFIVFFLLPFCYMKIDLPCDPAVLMADSSGNHFQWDPILCKKRDMCVPEGVRCDRVIDNGIAVFFKIFQISSITIPLYKREEHL